jgi:hypothetical protein
MVTSQLLKKPFVYQTISIGPMTNTKWQKDWWIRPEKQWASLPMFQPMHYPKFYGQILGII